VGDSRIPLDATIQPGQTVADAQKFFAIVKTASLNFSNSLTSAPTNYECMDFFHQILTRLAQARSTLDPLHPNPQSLDRYERGR
jgi:hypothetical protein